MKNNFKYFLIFDYMAYFGIDYCEERVIFMFGEKTNYSINIYGDVISYKGERPKILKYIFTKNGYAHVNLYIDNKQYLVLVHRLVAKAFLPNNRFLPIVNHKDGDKGSNSLNNLEWVTFKENSTHAILTGLHVPKYGEAHPASTLTEDVVYTICDLLEKGNISMKEIAKICSTTYTIVKKIKNGYRWKHISKLYNFSNNETNQKERKSSSTRES